MAPARRGAPDGRPPASQPGAAAREASGVRNPQIARIQRARILGSTFDLVAEDGAADVSVAHIVARSGVSRRTFYELFNDREDCLQAAFEQALAAAARRVTAAYDQPGRWRERVRRGLVALLSFLDEQPKTGRLLIAEPLVAIGNVRARRNQVLERLVQAVDEGRAESRNGAEPPPLTAEGAVGGALSIVQNQIARPAHEPLISLTNPLMALIVMPYLGAPAARRELGRAVTAASPGPPTEDSRVDPFKHAGMRLTYRTVRVLQMIAEHPGVSNRELGELAGVKDQGQISKLLRRLRRVGLIDNSVSGPGQGAPNAWTLTQAGRQMTDGILTHTRPA